MNYTNKHEAWVKFAAAALAGIVGNPESGCNSVKDLTDYAAKIADSMLKEAQQRNVTEG